MIADSGEEFWVRWYPCRPNALPLPFFQAFGSPVWEPDTLDQFAGPGDFHKPLHWRGKRFPAPPGQHWHGLPEWFEFGLPRSELGQGVPDVICGVPTMYGDGELEPSGSGEMSGSEGPIVSLIIQKDTLPSISGTVNNLALGDGTAYRLCSTGGAFITGLGDGVHGRLIILENVCTSPILLNHQSGSSLAANRIIAIDQVAVRLYPGLASWLQYDGTSQRWRELNTVPFISQKGDLLTHTDTVPSVLRSSGIPGDVLTVDTAEPTGLKWAPGGGGTGRGRDYNWYRQPDIGGSGGHYYVCTFADPRNSGPMFPSTNVIYFHPFISPRGGHLNVMRLGPGGIGIGTAPGIMGIYSSVSDTELYPDTLLDDTGPLTVTTTGGASGSIDVDLSGDQLYFLAVNLGTASGSFNLMGWTTPPLVWRPLYGTNSTLNGNQAYVFLSYVRAYDGTLPATIVAGDAVLDNSANIAHIGVAYDG